VATDSILKMSGDFSLKAERSTEADSLSLSSFKNSVIPEA
jgi:hypothetical protein